MARAHRPADRRACTGQQTDMRAQASRQTHVHRPEDRSACTGQKTDPRAQARRQIHVHRPEDRSTCTGQKTDPRAQAGRQTCVHMAAYTCVHVQTMRPIFLSSAMFFSKKIILCLKYMYQKGS